METVLRRLAEPLVLEPALTGDGRVEETLAGGCFNALFTRRAEKP